MKIKNKLGLPLFLLAFFVVMACSLGSVSAANEIHDVKIDDTNTDIQHPEANIHDSFIKNFLKNTDHASIMEAPHGTITSCNLNNAITDSDNFWIYQGTNSGNVQNSNINNAITNSDNSYICQGYEGGIVQNSNINNAITDIDSFYISQGLYDGTVQGSTLNNAVISSKGPLYINQGTFGGIISDSTINNTVIGSEHNRMRQNDISNSYINNFTLFSNNTFFIENNLSGVNGLFIAIGCNDYNKTIANLTDTNFFNLTIGNLEIFNFHW